MKKNVKRILLTISGILLCTMCTAGAEYIENTSYNLSTDRVEVRGSGFEEYKGQYATVLVMKDGATAENYSADKVEKRDMVLIGDDGKFSLDFQLSSQGAKTYTAYVKAGSLDVKSNTFKTLNVLQITVLKNNVLTSNPASLTDEELSAKIKAKSTDLQLDGTVYTSLDEDGKDKIAKFITEDEMNAIQAAVSENDNKKALQLLKDSVEKASYIQALNEGLGEGVVYSDGNFHDDELLALTDLADEGVTAYTLYQTAITAEGREFVLENLKNANYKDIDDFLDRFTYYATVAAIRNPKESGTGNIITVLKANKKRHGLDLTNYLSSQDATNEINILLSNNKKWDKESVQDILNTEISRGSSNSGGTGSSGGGSGSSYGGGYSQNYGAGSVSNPTTPVSTFTDLDSVEWARPAIERLAKKGIVSGRGDGIFAPNDNVTRAEFLTMILNTLGLNKPGAACNFSDVTTGDWYYSSVAAGTAIGIAVGYDNGAFGAKDNIIRQDAAVMLNNAVTKVGRTLTPMQDLIEFADSGDISDYAKTAVDTLVTAGVLNGSDGYFLPKNNCTRAQAAVMLSGLMDSLGMEG